MVETLPASRRRALAYGRWAGAAVVYIFMALTSVPVHADFNSGLAAYDAGDYATAAHQWRRAGEAGDVAAQRNLGHLYRWGKGVEQDLVEAARWYRRAAKAGFDRAQINLALLHLNGQGVKRDEAEAARWLSKAAEAGNPEARFRLAQLLETGTGVAVDRAKAYALYGLAARAGHKAAAIRLAGQPDGAGKLARKLERLENGGGPVKKPVAYVAKANAAVTRDKESALGEYLARRALDRPSKAPSKAPEPSFEAAAPTGAFMAHLASYKRRDRARAGWKLLLRDEDGLRDLLARVRRVDIPNRGRFYRLYAAGDAAKLRSLCESLVRKDKYCVLSWLPVAGKEAVNPAP